LKQGKKPVTFVLKPFVLSTANIAGKLQHHSNKPPATGKYLAGIYYFRLFTAAMVQRALKARYAQTLLGSLWIVVQPLLTLSVFVLVFDKLAGIYKESQPYALFAFIGLIGWNLFSHISLQGGNAVVQHRDLLKRLYFPKITLVLVQVIIGLIDFFIGLALILFALLLLGIGFSGKLLLLPFFILLNLLTGVAVALFMNIITVKKRDYYQALPYFINFGMWVTPVFYPVSIVPQNYRFLLYCNPMSGIIEGYRTCIFNTGSISAAYFPVYVLILLITLAGFYRFKEKEHTFVDTV